MRIDRRSFLWFTSSSSLVLGLPDLFAQSQSPEPPPWWKDALHRMKETGRPGLVFISSASEEGRTELGWAIRDLLESGDSRAREIFCASVVVCLRSQIAPACLPGDAAPNRIVVLDPSGKVVEKAELSGETLKEVAAFEERMSKLLHGEGEVRLAVLAERIRAKLTEPEKVALAELSDERIEVRDRAIRELEKSAETLMPLLVYERRRSKDPERAALVRRLIDCRFVSVDEISPGPRLPFGTRYEPQHSACGAEMEDGVPVQCGMGRLEGKGQRFLRFLEK